ncbi:MAG: EAL domain-containing protein [Gemmatimonadaceae bacterium]
MMPALPGDAHTVPRLPTTLDRRVWLDDWAGRALVIGGVYIVLFWIWLRTGWDGPENRALINNLAIFPLHALAITLAWRASCLAGLRREARTAWRLVAAAQTMYTIADAGWLYYEHIIGSLPAVSWVDPIYLTFYPLLLGGLVSFPAAPPRGAERLRFGLDLATVLVSAGLLFWYFFLRSIADAGYSSVFESMVALAYPLGDLVLLAGVVIVALRPHNAVARASMGFLALALLSFAAADLGYSSIVLERDYTSGSWPDALWIPAVWFLAASAHVHRTHTARTALRQLSGEVITANTGTRRMRLLPYAALLAGYGLLLAVALIHPVQPLSGLAIGAIGLTAMVVARQVVAERAARQSETRFGTLVHNSSDVIAVIGEDTRIRFVSPSAQRLFGVHPDELLGAELGAHLHPDDAGVALVALRTAAERPNSAPVLARVRRPDGSSCHTESFVSNLLDDPAVRGIVLNTRDVSDRAALEAQLTHQASHDPLTNLANRTLFRNAVRRTLSRGADACDGIAVVFLDLDNFKTVNDSLGHAAGDRLLVTVAERLLHCTRGADVVARLGGDEFAILLGDVPRDVDVITIIERLLGSMRRPVVLEGKEAFVGGSIGIARWKEGDSADDLLRSADVAMYMSKRRGKGRYHFFEPPMHAEALDRLELEAALRRAVAAEEFEVVFQPIVRLDHGNIIGIEALLRWTHAERGIIPPSVFIPLAEETGMVVPLGRYVLNEACAQLARWRALPGAANLWVAVNVSGRQLHETSLVSDVAEALAASNLDASALVLEATESVVMQKTETMLGRLRALEALGVRIALDDFGTGYSSLSYLHRFPIQLLKLDKLFVEGLGRGTADSTLARAILTLGSALGLRLVAEGIETAEQLTELRRLGYELGQGYYFSAPIVASEIETLIETRGSALGIPHSAAGSRAA